MVKVSLLHHHSIEFQYTHAFQEYLQMQNRSLPRMKKKKNHITKKQSFHTDKRTWPPEKYQSVERATYTLISGSIADLNKFF